MLGNSVSMVKHFLLFDVPVLGSVDPQVVETLRRLSTLASNRIGSVAGLASANASDIYWPCGEAGSHDHGTAAGLVLQKIGRNSGLTWRFCNLTIITIYRIIIGLYKCIYRNYYWMATWSYLRSKVLLKVTSSLFCFHQNLSFKFSLSSGDIQVTETMAIYFVDQQSILHIILW